MRYPILLTATIDASQDLFSSAWTEGNLGAIDDIVSVLGSFCCTVISIVGFGIVIFSILKNAMSGLYVVNPTFWDKVDDVKNQAINGMAGTVNELTGKSGNYAAQKVGGLFTFILGLIPNIKALTDFDDGVPVDKKQYFMKSIPLLIAQIFIGMLIFFGYPAKIAEWIGTGATYTVSAIINNVDPVEVVTGVADSLVTVTLATDNSQLPIEQTINKMAVDMTRVVNTRYSPEKQPLQESAYAMENALLSQFNVVGSVPENVLGSVEGYDISITVSAQGSVPTISQSYRPVNEGSQVYYAQATNGTYSFKYWMQAQSLPLGVPNVPATDYLVWTVQATPVSVSNTSAANLVVCGGINSTGTTSGTTTAFTINGIKFGNGSTDIQGTLGQNCTVEMVDSTGNTVASYTAKITSASIGGDGVTGVMAFASTARQEVAGHLDRGHYMRVILPGSWSYTVQNSTGASMTLKVTELRLTKGGSNMTGFLSTWTDCDMSTSTGVSITYSMTQQSSKAGTQ